MGIYLATFDSNFVVSMSPYALRTDVVFPWPMDHLDDVPTASKYNKQKCISRNRAEIENWFIIIFPW